MHGESDHISHPVPLDIPTGARYLGQSVCLISDKTPFLYIMGQHLVFDTRTRIFYEFPEFSSELVSGRRRPSYLFLTEIQDEIQAHQLTPGSVLLTNTHVIVVSYHLPALATLSSTVESTIIQAFVLPTNPRTARNETATLRLSHEGIIPDHLANLALIRNSTIDSITIFTHSRFLRLQPQGDRLCFSSVDLSFPESRSDIVLPLSIKLNDIFIVESGIYDHNMSPTGYYIEASDDGHARGFCRNRVKNEDPNSSWITKFTIDATGDTCVADVGQPSLPRWIHSEDYPRFSMLSFDGIIGKCCYLKSGHNWRLNGYVDVVVVDVK